MMSAQAERNNDKYESMAHSAWMTRQAYHAKKLKVSDLFKRSERKRDDSGRLETLKEKTRETNEWLAGLVGERGKG